MDATSLEKTSFAARLLKRLNLRFPGLFFILAILTLADFLIPDFIPSVDEIGLALVTLLLGLWKERKAATPPDATE